MPVTAGLGTDNANDDRESLLSILRDVSPNTDNYFMSNLGRSPDAKNTLHEWGVYNTARPTSVTTVVEGADPTYADLTVPTRTTNYTAIVNEPVHITGTVRAVDTITGDDPLVFQKTQALKRLKAKMEYLTINGVVSAGGCGLARQMNGFDMMISTGLTLRSSGTSFTETELNDIMQDSWTAVGSEYLADILVCPMVISRRISGFTANLTRMIDAKSKRLDSQVRVYGSQVGKDVMIIPHKDVRATNNSQTIAGNNLTVYALREDLWKHSFLSGREPSFLELAKTGDSEKGEYITEFTVVGFAQRASCKREGYMNNLTG
jgi:hypothetical protein